jgi:hypothetical protein
MVVMSWMDGWMERREREGLGRILGLITAMINGAQSKLELLHQQSISACTCAQ